MYFINIYIDDGSFFSSNFEEIKDAYAAAVNITRHGFNHGNAEKDGGRVYYPLHRIERVVVLKSPMRAKED